MTYDPWQMLAGIKVSEEEISSALEAFYDEPGECRLSLVVGY